VLKSKPAEVWTVGPNDTVYKALELMAEKNVGALPVVDGNGQGTVVGMFRLSSTSKWRIRCY